MAKTRKLKQVEEPEYNYGKLPTDRPVAVYYRQSTTGQVGNVATDMQKVDLVADMVRRGWREEDIKLIDADAGVSGTLRIEDREGMRELYELIANRRIGTVAAVAADRLFRDATMIEADKFIENCRKNAVIVLAGGTTYAFHSPIDGDMHRKVFRTKCEAAADALKLIKERMGGARARMRREGKFTGQMLPLGYMAVHSDKRSPDYGKIVPFPAYAALTHRIFEVFVEMDGNPRETYRRLKAEGFSVPPLSECPPPQGYRTHYRKIASGIPAVKSIIEMVQNVYFLGHFTDGETGAVIRWSNHEPIIEERLFFQAFNLISKIDLHGNPNPHYAGRGRTHKKKESAPRTAERPLCEGKVYVDLNGNGELNKTGVRYTYQHRKGQYSYVYDPTAQRPEDGRQEQAANWQRVAEWLDEAIVYHLRERLLSSLDMDEITETIRDKEAARTAERRHIERQIKEAEARLKLHSEKIARLTNLSLIDELERDYTATEADYKRLLAKREQLAAKPDSDLSGLLKRLAGINRPETLPRDELRRYVFAFINRITVITDGNHQGDDIRIEWVDGKATDFRLPHRPGAHGWTFTEIAALDQGMAEGWTQRELARAIPNHTWHEIQIRIGRKYGTGRKVPKTREGERFTLVGLELAYLTEKEIRRLSKAQQSEAWQQRRRAKLYAHERWGDYCVRVLGFVPDNDDRQLLIAAGDEQAGVGLRNAGEIEGDGGVFVTEQAADKIVSKDAVSAGCVSGRRNLCRG